MTVAIEQESDWSEQLYVYWLPRVQRAIKRYRECGSIHAFEGTSLLYVAFQVAEERWLSWAESSALTEIQKRLEDEQDHETFEFDSVPEDSSAKWDEYDVLPPADRELIKQRKKYHYRRHKHRTCYQRWVQAHRLAAS